MLDLYARGQGFKLQQLRQTLTLLCLVPMLGSGYSLAGEKDLSLELQLMGVRTVQDNSFQGGGQCGRVKYMAILLALVRALTL